MNPSSLRFSAFCLAIGALGVAGPLLPTAIAHGKKTVEITSDRNVPAVELIVRPDAKQGWNLEIKTANFRFAPERVNQSSLAEEGHAHLYINGKKVARLYGPWYHIESLPPGENRLMVTLNTNRHEDLSHRGKAIHAVAIVRVAP